MLSTCMQHNAELGVLANGCQQTAITQGLLQACASTLRIKLLHLLDQLMRVISFAVGPL